MAIAEEAMPEGYDGTAMWGFLENRPYLSALHGAALCYLQLRQRKNAVPLLEKIRRCNPEDNQGVRYMLGSEYLRTGETKKALELFKTEAEHYPPYHYERGLLHLMDSNWVIVLDELTMVAIGVTGGQVGILNYICTVLMFGIFWPLGAFVALGNIWANHRFFR